MADDVSASAARLEQHAAASRLHGRRILITGGGSGIGRATAEIFHAEGARVALLDVNEAGLREVAARTDGVVLKADVTDEVQVAGAVEAGAAAMGGIDGVVNAAGIVAWGSLGDTDFATWRRVMSVNVDGPFLVCRAALPWLRKAKAATIVNIASGQALLPGASISAYATSKGALVTFTRALAIELAPTIRANSICPGTVDTPMIAARGGPSSADAARYALRRVASPLEVVEAILFLTSMESSFVTGAALAVDGGRTFH